MWSYSNSVRLLCMHLTGDGDQLLASVICMRNPVLSLTFLSNATCRVAIECEVYNLTS